MGDIGKLVETVSSVLEKRLLDDRRDPPNEDQLEKIVRAQAAVLELGDDSEESGAYNEAEIMDAFRRLETSFSIRMKVGALFQAEDYKPWLSERQGDIDWYYWTRYRKYLLTTKCFPPHVVRTLDDITDKIVDNLEDPEKEGAWARRGMVVGHVQSGKTANYTGLVCKAADAGYKVIIILAGLLNSLRNQTQERIDSDFMGWCTRNSEHIGVAKFSEKRRPVCFTTSLEDFKRNAANAIAMQLDALKEPVVLVLKKNKSTLENLHKWLLGHNRHNLRDFPMLLVDDEADHASINTNKDEKDPTAINLAIRNLLSIFERSSFVGYTATPFANIFIDPENEDEMENGAAYKDLFPRDFILSLDPPDNYVGPQRLFTSDADLDCVRDITDNEDLLPVKHKIDFDPLALPESLKEAINCFIIARAIRLLRGQTEKHHSMMINVSRFTGIQERMKGLVLERVKDLRSGVNNFSGLSSQDALRDSAMASLHHTWNKEYREAGCTWAKVQPLLKEAIGPVEVLSVNSSSKDTLDYSRKNYPKGRTLIALGGLGLSRGLTLEGLLVSYFLRNSIMYDTLMQMGRWFGYRDGHADLCRIYMSPDASSWYAHIAEATEELRSDFTAMEKARMTPLQFGLRVRSHPTSLIVTARNKMRAGRKVPHRVSLEGRLIETLALSADETVIQDNISLVERTLDELAEKAASAYRSDSLGYVWENAPVEIAKHFVENFINHPQSFYTHYHQPLVEHLSWLEEQEIRHCDVLLKTLKRKKGDDPEIKIGGLHGRLQTRNQETAQIDDGFISFKKKARIGEARDEEVGIDPDVLKAMKLEAESKTLNPRTYRAVEGKRPLLIIHLLQIPHLESLKGKPVAAYGLSFPGNATSRRPRKLVEYVVNIPYWNQTYAETSGDDEPE